MTKADVSIFFFLPETFWDTFQCILSEFFPLENAGYFCD